MVPFSCVMTTADPCAHPALSSPPDTVQMAADCQKELQNGALSQLETCLQRLPVHVCNANGKYHAAIAAEREIDQFQSETLALGNRQFIANTLFFTAPLNDNATFQITHSFAEQDRQVHLAETTFIYIVF